jgi:hypothetical protein
MISSILWFIHEYHSNISQLEHPARSERLPTVISSLCSPWSSRPNDIYCGWQAIDKVFDSWKCLPLLLLLLLLLSWRQRHVSNNFEYVASGQSDDTLNQNIPNLTGSLGLHLMLDQSKTKGIPSAEFPGNSA